MNCKKQTHIDEIDIAKGIGIVLVIIGHTLPEKSFFRQIIYSFHMPLFMILSGVVIGDKSENNLSDSIKKENKLFYTCKYIKRMHTNWHQELD